MTSLIILFHSSQVSFLLESVKLVEWLANCLDPDPDQKPHSVASDLGLHCLLKPFCP